LTACCQRLISTRPACAGARARITTTPV
jgi:hypothetical protein